MIEAVKKDLLLSIVFNYEDMQTYEQRLINKKLFPNSGPPTGPYDFDPRTFSIPLNILHSTSKLEWSLFQVALDEIIKDGFLRNDVKPVEPFETGPPKTTTINREVSSVAYTSTGKVFFIYQGGYKAQERRLEIERQTQVSDRLWNRSNILIALAAFVVSYCSYRGSEFNKQNSTEQQTTIDSLKKQIDILQADIRRIAPTRKPK